MRAVGRERGVLRHLVMLDQGTRRLLVALPPSGCLALGRNDSLNKAVSEFLHSFTTRRKSGKSSFVTRVF